jgi:hypothetical protein
MSKDEGSFLLEFSDNKSRRDISADSCLQGRTIDIASLRFSFQCRGRGRVGRKEAALILLHGSGCQFHLRNPSALQGR